MRRGHLKGAKKKPAFSDDENTPWPRQVQRSDVLVIGGGLVGAVAARALSHAGLSVTVIDGEDPKTATKAGFDGRASAIAAASERLLSALDIWPHLVDQVSPILDIRVADGASPMYLHYDHEDVGLARSGIWPKIGIFVWPLWLRLRQIKTFVLWHQTGLKLWP